MNETFKNVILRADGNGELGYGHLSRLNALADLISTEFKIIFLILYNSNFYLIENNDEIAIIPKGSSFEAEADWINKKI